MKHQSTKMILLVIINCLDFSQSSPKQNCNSYQNLQCRLSSMETIIVGSSQRDIVELDNEFYHSNHQNISLIDKIFPKQLSKQIM